MNAVKINAFGDIMFGVCSNTKQAENKTIPFKIRAKSINIDSLREFQKAADFSLANLEGPISSKYRTLNNKKSLLGPPEALCFLKELKIDLVSLANNHSFDYGIDVLNETKALLRSNYVSYLHSPEYQDNLCFKRFNGKNICFIGYGSKPYYQFETDTISDPDYYKNYDFFIDYIDGLDADTHIDYLSFGNILPLVKQIKEIKNKADIIILYIHWGFAGTHIPSPLQIKIAHKLCDLGVDVIIGNHPHVIQPIEYYKGKIISYSLGNFLFDSWKKAKKTSIALQLIYDNEVKADPFIVYRNEEYKYSLLSSKFREHEFNFYGKLLHWKYPESLHKKITNAQKALSSYYTYGKYLKMCKKKTVMAELNDLLISDLKPTDKITHLVKQLF